MTELLIHTLPNRGRAVLVRLRAAIEASHDDRLLALLPRLPRFAEGEPFRLVVTGEYNAGKSTLLQALTGEPVPIDSNVTTAESREFSWREVLVVDTPGVNAGDRLHDERAERALREADLVVFVFTVDLFDPNAAEHLRHVAFSLNKLEQMILVANKSASLPPAREAREAAVREALRSPTLPLPLIECDAKSACDATTAPDAERAAFLVRRGNLAGLEDALDSLVAKGGTEGRWKVPFDAALAVIDDAQPFLEPEPEEEDLILLAARRREVLAQSRLRLDNRLEGAFGATRDRIVALGQTLTLAAKDGLPSDTAVQQFEQGARDAAEALEGKVQQAFDREQTELAAEGHGLVEGPEARRLADAGMLEIDLDERQYGQGRQSRLPTSPFVQGIRRRVTKEGTNWLKTVAGSGDRPGAPMHSLVLKVGRKAGYKFKPWEAVKWAGRLSTAATAGLALYQVWDETRALTKEEDDVHRQQLQLRAEVQDAADALVEAAQEQVEPFKAQFYADMSQPLEEIEGQLGDLSSTRSALTRELTAIRTECLEALSTIASIEPGASGPRA
jgi:GTP-binding protein EngB required for normal cell division